jgi:hypothetical protein
MQTSWNNHFVVLQYATNVALMRSQIIVAQQEASSEQES